jgi:hypothetical protein
MASQVLEDVHVVAQSPMSSPKSKASSSGQVDCANCVVVGGTHFGFDEEQLMGALEECVIEVKERCSALETSEYFDQEIEDITRQLEQLRCSVNKLREKDKAESQRMTTAAVDHGPMYEQVLSLRSKVSQLLRELDEQEWDINGSSDDDDAEWR